jgi:hypothetical protein
MLNVSVTSTNKEQLEQLCNTTIDNTQDFTDSIYISIEQREKVLQYHKKLQDQLEEIIQLISGVCFFDFLNYLYSNYRCFRNKMIY